MTDRIASPALDKLVQSAHIWLKDLMYELNQSEADQTFHLLQATLQTLRDRLPAVEAVHLGAQLPAVIRGIYYEGWKFSETPVKSKTKEEFLERITEKYNAPLGVDTETAARAVFKLLYHHISEGEVKKIKNVTPEQLRELWPRKVS